MTIKQLFDRVKNQLSIAGIDSPAFESFLLLEHFYHITRNDLYLYPNKDCPHEDISELQNALKERISGRPLQYILGWWEFYGLHFFVGEGVLIPRPDTETVVDACLTLLKSHQNPVIIDLCSGSGCIGITLAAKIPQAKVIAVEFSKDAYQYLQKNIAYHQLKNIISIFADVLSMDTLSLLPSADLIVSNPPYIDESEKSSLQREVLSEPAMALFAPENGLFFYRQITAMYQKKKYSGGHLVFEIGYQQADAVHKILQENNYLDVTVQKDLGMHPRVIFGRKA